MTDRFDYAAGVVAHLTSSVGTTDHPRHHGRPALAVNLYSAGNYSIGSITFFDLATLDAALAVLTTGRENLAAALAAHDARPTGMLTGLKGDCDGTGWVIINPDWPAGEGEHRDRCPGCAACDPEER